MNEGEIKKRINEIFERDILEPDGLWVIEEYEKILDEVKQDLGLDRTIWKKKDLERMLENSNEYTQLEKSFLELCLKLMKWFGE